MYDRKIIIFSTLILIFALFATTASATGSSIIAEPGYDINKIPYGGDFKFKISEAILEPGDEVSVFYSTSSSAKIKITPDQSGVYSIYNIKENVKFFIQVEKQATDYSGNIKIVPEPGYSFENISPNGQIKFKVIAENPNIKQNDIHVYYSYKGSSVKTQIYPDNSGVYTITNIKGALEVSANVEKSSQDVKITFKFNDDHQTILTIMADANSQFELPATPFKRGYVGFWYNEDGVRLTFNEKNQIMTSDKNMNLSLKWNRLPKFSEFSPDSKNANILDVILLLQYTSSIGFVKEKYSESELIDMGFDFYPDNRIDLRDVIVYLKCI